MGRINTSGLPARCDHCGHEWLTKSQAEVTSCPRCGWRVRIRSQGQQQSSHQYTDKPRMPLI